MTRSKSGKLKWTIVTLFFITACGVLFLENWPEFGGTVSGDRLKRAQVSPHYRDGGFVNTLPHPPLELGDVWGYSTEQFLCMESRTIDFCWCVCFDCRP